MCLCFIYRDRQRGIQSIYIAFGQPRATERMGQIPRRIGRKRWPIIRNTYFRLVYRRVFVYIFFSTILLLGDMTGEYSAYTIYEGHEIMFHVSTMLPYSKDNRQQVNIVSLDIARERIGLWKTNDRFFFLNENSKARSIGEKCLIYGLYIVSNFQDTFSVNWTFSFT